MNPPPNAVKVAGAWSAYSLNFAASVTWISSKTNALASAALAGAESAEAKQTPIATRRRIVGDMFCCLPGRNGRPRQLTQVPGAASSLHRGVRNCHSRGSPIGVTGTDEAAG